MNGLLEKSLNRVHAHGGWMAPQRRLILETLETLGHHPTADELYETVRRRDPSLNLSTVYRTLRWLEEEGLVSARFFDRAAPHEHAGPGKADGQYHFLCTNCGREIKFGALLVNTIKAQFELHTGADVERGSVTLYGLCTACKKISD